MIKNFQMQNWINLKSWRPYFIIFVVGFLLYSQTFLFGLTYLDDNTLILEHTSILQNVKNIKNIFSTDVFMSGGGSKFYYRPLLNLSLMLDNHLGGVLPFIYHLDNILLHILTVILLFCLLDCLFKNRILAFFFSLIFLVHPVLTQAVAWIPGRNDSLLTIFILAAFLSFLKFFEYPKLKFLAAYAFFFGLALFTKETAIFLPILIIVYFISIGRKTSLALIDRFLVLIISLVPGFIWLIMHSLAFSKENIRVGSAIGSVINNLPNTLAMAGKMIFPFNLSVLPDALDSTMLYGIIALIILVVALIFSKQKRYDYLFFGATWFLVFFLPPFAISNSVPYFLEHRLYLPIIGFLIILAEIDFIKNLNFNRRRVQLISLFVLLILSGITFYHSKNFSDQITFWQAAVKTSPHSPLAQKNLGAMYYFEGDYYQAINHDTLALSLNPREPMVHNNLGVIYMDQKKYSEAEKEFKKELEINPGYDKALNNLQDLYYRQKQLR